MNLQRIVLSNFLSHRNTDFDLSKRNPVIIVGENGAGKSSLVKDSITWCLFGKARGSGDEMITEGFPSCLVEVEFELSGNTYTIIRTRERGKKTTLRLLRKELQAYLGGQTQIATTNLDGATIAETQEKIEQLLGMTYDTFITTACIEQGKANAFSTLTPSDAKQVVMDILQLGQYDRYMVAARTQMAILQTNYQILDNEQRQMEKQLDGISGVIAALTSEREVSADLRQRIRLYEQGLKETEDELKSVESALSAAASQGTESTMYRRQLADAMKNVESKKAKLTKSETKCPLCATLLTADHLATVLAELDRRLGTYREELEKAEVKWAVLYDTIQHNQNIHSRLASKKGELGRGLKDINEKLQKVQESVGMLTAKEEEQKKLVGQIAVSQQQGLKTKWTLESYTTLERAFGKNGIPALIIENIIPEIEETANIILGLLSDQTLQIGLRTQKELKTGGVGDTLEIVVRNLTKTRGYGIISGGEGFRVDLALRIALSSVMARRNSFKCETMVIDEGFGSLDAVGRQKFVELSKMLGDRFKRLIIVTHTDVAEMYPDVVVVRKENGVSRVC